VLTECMAFVERGLGVPGPEVAGGAETAGGGPVGQP